MLIMHCIPFELPDVLLSVNRTAAMCTANNRGGVGRGCGLGCAEVAEGNNCV